MRRNSWRVVAFVFGWLGAVVGVGLGQEKAEGEKERREEALAISRAAAGEYAMRVGEGAGLELELNREPVFRWSNPEVGDVYGNIFIWTREQRQGEVRRGSPDPADAEDRRSPAPGQGDLRSADVARSGARAPTAAAGQGDLRSGDVSRSGDRDTTGGRPLVVGSLFHWFSSGPIVGGKPSTMEHELISLAEEPIAAKFHGEEVWATREAGVKFAEIPKAPAPAASEAQRNAQLRQLAREFTGLGVFRTSPGNLELRLLPQPIYRYAAAEDGVLTGGLFAFVRATDPEILLVIEARNKDTAGKAHPTWQFAAVRMHSMAELWLEHDGERVWQAASLPIPDIFEKHNRPYTAFKFREIPDFLKGAEGRE